MKVTHHVIIALIVFCMAFSSQAQESSLEKMELGSQDRKPAPISSNADEDAEAPNALVIQHGFQLINESVSYARQHPEDTAGIQRRREAIWALHAIESGYKNSSPREGL